MDLFEQLRREHEFGIGTIAGVAAKFGVHRRMVRQAIAGALPPPHAYPQRIKPKLDGVMAFIDAVHDPSAIDAIVFTMSVAFVWPAIVKPRRRRLRPS